MRQRLRTWVGNGLWRVLDTLPLMLVASLATFSVVAVIFLIAGQLRSELVWPIGLALGSISGLLVYELVHHGDVPQTRELKFCNILVLIGVVVWVGFNMHYSSQHLITDRDPATYAVAGAWLVDHDNIKIPVADDYMHVSGVVPQSLGFAVSNTSGETYIYAQGQHLLPALLGLTGRIVGKDAMLKTNVVFGGLALLAIYSFARMLGRPRWALIITAALAASMPFMYFARDTYTEPLTALFTFGGLSILWAAQRTGRYGLWALAGLVLGAGALTRIDAYLTFVAIVLFAAIWLALAVKKERTVRLWQTSMLCIGLAISGVVGWLDVSYLARPYYLDLHGQFAAEMWVLGAVLVGGIVVTAVAWRTNLLKAIHRKTQPWRGSAIGLASIAFILLLACRPFVAWYLAGLNNTSTVPAEHSYAEITTYWIAWYLGPILALLGLGGFALAAARAFIRRRNLVYVPALLVISLTCLVYLIKPSITPDQIWASRRLLPVILPGVAVFAVMALDWIGREFLDGRRLFNPAVSAMLGTAIVVGALFVSSPLILLRDTAQLAPIETSCRVLPENGAVLMVGMASQKLQQPIHAYCGTAVAGYDYSLSTAPRADTLTAFAQVARTHGLVPIVGVFGSDQAAYAPSGGMGMGNPIAISYWQLEHTYLSPPQHILTENDVIRYGIIQEDGDIKPL